MNNRFRFWAVCVLLTIVLWPASSLNAQNETVVYGKENIARDYCDGYNISIIIKDVPDHYKLYLWDYDFGNWRLIDSAEVRNGKASFRKKCSTKSNGDVKGLIPKGFYDINGEDLFPFQMIINQQTVFDVEVDVHNPNHFSNHTFKKSDENQLMKTVNFTWNEHQDAFEGAKAAVELTSAMPQSFLGQYYLLEAEILKTAQSDDPAVYFAIGSASPSEFHHILSLVDFTDARLCHTSSLLYPFIKEYLTSENRKSVDEIITEVDTILVRAARGGRYQCGMYAKWLYEIFDKTGDPYYEPVMLHIYDTYDRGWISEGQERRIKRQMDRIRKLAPGAQIPELTAYDINGKQHSTNEIETKYTVLWFWDPDCDHCQEETPILHDIYQKQADELNFEVFAVEVNDDYDRWKAFSEKHGLNDWVNLSTSMGETSVDYIEYFDIVTTPVILLIDNEKNHTIIARQVTLEELVKKMGD